jgi:ribosomal protein S18 acetylase RimI-like enzyme
VTAQQRPQAELAWRVERAGRAAWPAPRKLWLGDWQLHFSDDPSRRANSANPLRPDPRTSEGFVRACEALYRCHRRPAIFRLPSLIGPAFDERLGVLGYRSEGESLVLYGEMAGFAAAADAAVRLLTRPTANWFAAMAALQGHGRRQGRSYRRIVAGLVVPAAFALLSDGGAPAGLAYGALHDHLLCCESVVVDPGRRRQGHARRVLSRLAAWAGEMGAEGVCLEVAADNAPALALYDTLGLCELYRYHYRRQRLDRR